MGAKPGSRKGFAFKGRSDGPTAAKGPWGKRALVWAILLAALAGAYTFFQDRIVDAKLRPLLERQLSEAIQSPVTIGSVRASLTGNVLLNDLSLTMAGHPWESHVQVGQVAVQVGLWDLLVRHRPPQDCMESLSFLEPRITLVKNGKESGGSPNPVTPGVAAPIPVFPVPQISIKSGSFLVQAEKEPRLVLRGLDFKARLAGPSIWGMSLQAHSPDKENPGVLQFDGSFRQDPTHPGAKGTLKLERWPLAGLGPAIRGVTGWDLTKGSITIVTPLVFEAGKPIWFDGHADLESADLKTPGPLVLTFADITGRANLRPNEVRILGGLDFHLGATPWRATGSVPLDGRPLDAQASTDHLAASTVLEDILKARVGKVEGAGGSANLWIRGLLSDPILSGTARLGPTTVAGWPLDSLLVQGTFAQQTLTFQDIQGKLMGGSLTGRGYISLSDRPDAPVSLQGRLTGLDASQAGKVLGLSQTQGHIDEEVLWSGPRDRTVLSSTGHMEILRTLRNTPFRYSIVHTLQWKDRRLQVEATLNDRSRIEAIFTEAADAWDLDKFLVLTDKKTVRLSGNGVWPKDPERPIRVEVSGKDIPLKGLPIFSDQFPDIEGNVDVALKVGGTQKEPAATARLSSREVSLKGQESEPMEVALTYRPGEVLFDKLEIGENGEKFSVSGRVGLEATSSLDLSIRANEVPLQTIAEIGGWNNPPQPFEGLVKGKLRLTGTKKNPLLEGDEIFVSGLRVGDWHSEELAASLKMEGGKLLVRKLRLGQKEGSLDITGNWDTQASPGAMSLKFMAKDFQLGMGPYLSGTFLWNARVTGDPFWKAWNGTFSGDTLTLTDLNHRTYAFKGLNLSATMADSQLKGKLRLGDSISGSTELDLSGPAPALAAQLHFDTVPIKDLPEVGQFIPSALKITGKFNGDLRLSKGPWADLPLSGTLQLNQGKIQNYDFDRLEFHFDGNKKKVQATASLTREQAKYSLTGSLASPVAIWDMGSVLSVHGPVEKEKFKNILALLGFRTQDKRIGGEVHGELSVEGTLAKPKVGFAIQGTNLRYGETLVPSAEFHFAESEGRISLDQNRIELEKGVLTVDGGSIGIDAKDPTQVNMDLGLRTQDVPMGPFHMNSQVHFTGKAFLESRPGRSDLEGQLLVIEKDPNAKDPDAVTMTAFGPMRLKSNGRPPVSFLLALKAKDKVIELLPTENGKTQLVGGIDLSQDQRIAFKELKLLNSTGSFSLDGSLDLEGGPCQLTSDAKDVPIQEIAKWIFPKFPLQGTGNYHLMLNGTLAEPLLTASFSLSRGRVGDLDFDLLSGVLKSKENTLYLGDDQNPLTLSRSGKFTFTAKGKMPISLTRDGWLKVQNRDMDIDAAMEKGDFGLILLGGLAKKASGSMDFSAHLGGPLDNPDLTLDLDLADCQMVPSMVADRIDDISGHIKVRHNLLAVDSLNGRIGQGRVFISSPPIEKSKMKLVNFIPQYFDFRVQTVGNHGLWLSVPTIMRGGEWGEIYFYGETPNDPMVISGPLERLVVSGTALLDSGHFTFPPIPALDENGNPIEYRELAGVTFDLKLLSGKNTWYSNDFNSNYLELQVDPGNAIKLEGRDSDSTPDEAGIKVYGSASSTQGWLWYLNHKFTMESGWVQLSKGAKPFIKGKAVDHWHNVDIISAGGVRKTDVDIWVNLSGTFGKIDFTLESSPLFDPTDKDKQQKLLYSYVMFGRDMTGYTSQALQQAYEQNYGQAAGGALVDALNRIALNEATRSLRPYAQQIIGADVVLKGQPLPSGSSSGSQGASIPGVPDSSGNTPPGLSTQLLDVELTKQLDSKLSVRTDIGVSKGVTGDLSPQGRMGLDYLITPKLKASGSYGSNDVGQQEARVGLDFTAELPDIKTAKKDDKTKPNFERLDIYPVGSGKFSVLWTTDKVTKNVLTILDGDGHEVQVLVEKQDFEYRHNMIVDGLSPEADYLFRLTAKDLSDNSRTIEKKVSAGAE